MTNVPKSVIYEADARELSKYISTNSIDLVLTSPPYWQCRDYDHPKQIGQEATAEEYVDTLLSTIDTWRHLLRPHASVIINIDDVFRNGSLVGIPAMFEIGARRGGWIIANRAVWAKSRGMPEPQPYRLASRYEFLIQLTLQKNFFFDLYALSEYLGGTANPGDVWNVDPVPSSGGHLAPFPDELARRAILIACPEQLCQNCGKPYERELERTATLNPNRKQAQRAMELLRNSNLTNEHIAAVRAVGISDAGKGRIFQNGANKNAARTMELAREAKEVLGGYFREFTFAPKRQVGWRRCNCEADPAVGTVLDPFLGSGTTVRVATQLGRHAIGADLNLPDIT